jgi:hypothetical protein
MLRIDVSFLVLATACLLATLVASLGAGVAGDAGFTPVHAHLALVGFTSLAVLGLSYKLYPALQRSRLALPNLLASGAGGLILPLGAWLAPGSGPTRLTIIASAAMLGGALLFAANLIWNVALSSPRAVTERVVPWAA